MTPCSYRNAPIVLYYDNPMGNRIFAIYVYGGDRLVTEVTSVVGFLLQIKLMTTEKEASITLEDAKRYMEGLQDVSCFGPGQSNGLPDLWKEFFGRDDIKSILRKAIYASCSQGRIDEKQLAYAIFEYTIVDYNWVPKELESDDPVSFLSYFKKTVRNLLTNRKFMREHFYIDLIVQKDVSDEESEGKRKRVVKEDDRKIGIDVNPENGRPLADTLPSGNVEKRAEFKENLDIFKSIVKIVEKKYPKHGELLRRYYQDEEDIHDIARDYLRRGVVSVKGKKWYDDSLWTEDIIEGAVKNLQNSMLPKAREKFDLIAIHLDFDYQFGKK